MALGDVNNNGNAEREPQAGAGSGSGSGGSDGASAGSGRRRWRRFVAVGDSFTEGMCDPLPGDAGADAGAEGTAVAGSAGGFVGDIGVGNPVRFRGWADRVADVLARENAEFGEELLYANLAVRGRMAPDVTGRQLDAALALEPDLVAISAGGNDIIRRKATPGEIRERLEAAVVRIRATGADVLMATGPHLLHFPVLSQFNGQFGAFSADVFSLCARHGAYVIDVWGFRPLRHPLMWAEDRLHLSSLGHERIADVALEVLGREPVNKGFREELPPVVAKPKSEQVRETAVWAKTYLQPWLARRVKGVSSGDGMEPKRPNLTPVRVENGTGGE